MSTSSSTSLPLDPRDVALTQRPVERASMLPPAAFVDPDVLDWELDQLFRGWICAAHISAVDEPGKFVTRELGADSVMIIGGEDGTPRAFLNVCRHRGARIVEEPEGNVRKRLRCPYHAWSYDLDGQLRAAPHMDGVEDFDFSCNGLLGVRLAVVGGLVLIDLSGGAPEPEEHVGDLIAHLERYRLPDLERAGEAVYEVEANWKVIVENYNECLHCPTVHPELVKVVPLFRFGEVWDDEMRDGGNDMAEGATSFTMEGRSELPTLPGLLDEDLGRYYGSYQFPNLMLNLHPDCVMYYIGYPRGPSHTTVVSEYLFPPDVIADPARFKPEPVVELWDLISKQDWEVCQRAQTGVGSRAFTTGVYPRQDRFLYSFNEDYRVRMGREPLG